MFTVVFTEVKMAGFVAVMLTVLGLVVTLDDLIFV